MSVAVGSCQSQENFVRILGRTSTESQVGQLNVFSLVLGNNACMPKWNVKYLRKNYVTDHVPLLEHKWTENFRDSKSILLGSL